jgi:hypothetical protein
VGNKRPNSMMLRRIVWMAVALVLMFAAIYAFKSAGSMTASTWVLWEKTMTMKDGGDTSAWEPLDGFDRLSDCHESAREIIQDARAFMTSGGRTLVAVRPDGRSAVYTVTEDGAQHTTDYRLLCFPGPFDPRPVRP